ncbi:MAG: isoprenyl transferase [Clostridiales bacterium]|nr:isoprenyl transferase [Clostridiales bacterium]
MYKGIFSFIKHIQPTRRLIKQVNSRPVPRHIAIIMDGNGRWAQKRGLSREMGHRYGSESLKDIIESTSDLGIEYLTVFAFSTENWKRPTKEINALMDLLVDYIDSELDRLKRNNIKMNVLGDLGSFPEKVQQKIYFALDNTKDNTGLKFNIALNYGGRDDILNAVRGLADDIQSGKLAVDDIDKSIFYKYLYTGNMPDPDLLIRTSGEYRLSNFLLYQIAYTELWFSKPSLLWPDFNQRQYLKAILDYQNRQRRFGAIT